MKTRVISGVIGGFIGVALTASFMTIIPDIFVYIIVLMGTYELIKVFGVKNKATMALGIIFSAGVLIYNAYAHLLSFQLPVSLLLMLYVFLMFAIMLIDFEHTTFQQTGLTILVSFLLPAAASTIIKMKYYVDEFEAVSRGHARFLFWFTVSAAVLSDTFALFAGVNFGKHKLSPKISPKKTVEGAIGGVVGSVLVNIIAQLLCNWWCHTNFPIPLWVMILLNIAASLVSILGDLTASTIKRNCGIKDFGNLIPGHGGIMDRLDSIIFVLPFVYYVLGVLFKIYC